ncbi:helix-turn-helix domain-containing protein [Dyadobacter fermentans]|uniref:Helix-turn-helix domain protein n=1 Tax=Dyadobacter fermentans (strain ATCC 700827 / DSM 18053 / CIP 107007 / KCTC 52180 / NS114) TaxID=471854 RepID=C6W3B2_DYAFD|nr:helix-turn-helix transcriptional regulator [Dyadobacter fermentans]ACT92216.1 helix-turn-helix domain protein [Dyadobacter fermentans DSM 18053]
MSTSQEMTKHIHHGRNIKRFREMLGIKQEGLAFELGGEWSQKRVSLLEQKEVVEQEILDQVAQILKVPAEAIKNFDEDKALNVISNTFNSHDSSTMNAVNVNPTFNPLDKLIESYDENRKLYERLLTSEQEKVELLKRLLENAK